MNSLVWCVFYAIVVMFSFTMNNWLSMWTMLELTTWIAVVIIVEEVSSSEVMFKFYLVSSLSSMMLLYLWFVSWFPAWWVLFIVMFKLGLPPVHWWMGWILKSVSWMSMWFLTVIHKIVPFVVSMLVVDSVLVGVVCLVSIVWSVVSYWNVSSVFVILFYSSCVHSSWLWLASSDLSKFVIYYFMYASMMFVVMWGVSGKSCYDITISYMFMLLLGLPTSFLFFSKWTVITVSLSFVPLLSWFILMVSVVSLYPYMRVIWSSFVNSFVDLSCYYYLDSMVECYVLVMHIFGFMYLY
uniref:Nad2 protein n=1 Tax=Trichinella zimbabwensis TaxID=268475 RepID=A0A0A0V358_9BILA|nr:NADH dehydrogenase subunit 2 [Trichinella zimbabwensis]AIW57075.1 NADH dehydrogenase subunit 2 [Trichinella zimbabwensis]